MELYEDGREFLKRSVVGKMFDVISSNSHDNDFLVFGCGDGNFPLFIRAFFPDSHVTGYDFDAAKIEKAIQLAKADGTDNHLSYTAEKPTIKFGVVLVSHVLHHYPSELSSQVIKFVKPHGLMGIMDYDMGGCKREKFFQRFGRAIEEKDELKKMGADSAYWLHTDFSLDECIRLMLEKGIQHVGYEGEIPSLKGGISATDNFYYVGRNP